MSFSKESLSPPLPPPAYLAPSHPPPSHKSVMPAPTITDPEKAVPSLDQDKATAQAARAHERAVRRIIFHTWFGFQFWVIVLQMAYMSVWMFLIMFESSIPIKKDSIIAWWLDLAPVGFLCTFAWILWFIVELVPVNERCKMVTETTSSYLISTILGLLLTHGQIWLYAWGASK